MIFQGLLNFYSLADNYSRLHRILYLLRYGCALTLASKNKLGTLKKVFKKFTLDLKIKGPNGNILASFPNESLVKSSRKITIYTVAESAARIHPLLKLTRIYHKT